MNDYASDISNEDSNNEDSPVIILHPQIGSSINTHFECPLKTASEYTLTATQQSAHQGCPQCILRATIISQLFPSMPETSTICGSHDYIFLPFHIEGQRIIIASNKPPPEPEDYFLCDFYGEQIGGIDSVERLPPCDTSSLQSLATVKNWIETCDKEHKCMPGPGAKLPGPGAKLPGPGAKLPKRLLDVRNNRIRLHETCIQDIGLRYACLSHCWGYPPTTILRTTPRTLNSYRQSMPCEDLPRTFQDAVSMTRKLDLAFLWIDSLCIVQDESDKSDWQEQSAEMANIYRNAYITFAATAAKDADGGCYTRENTSRLHQATSPLAVVRCEDGSEWELCARRKFDHDVDSLPLLQRGWVCQERLLSPRVLHFTGEEVVWECSAGVQCECGGDDLEDKFDRMRIFDPEYVVVGPNSQHPAPLDLWYSITSEYTALSLTRASDALPALSGIAKAFAEKIGDEYVAGMWKSTLISNLLWFFKESGRRGGANNIALPWRAPSWSWASVIFGSEIRFLPVTQELAVVQEVICKPSGADPTGELEAAHLTVTTKTLPASFDNCSGVMCIDGSLDVLKATDKYSHSRYNIETGYFDLHPPPSDVDIVLAQMALCTGEQQVYLHGVHAPIHIEQQIRSYVVLARRDAGWLRIGLATIAEYTPDMILGGYDKRAITNMSREGIEALLEESADQNRSIFRRIDGTDVKDIVIW
jgi:hypothetical protein